ncbi:MAG TPA: DinB family protein [Bryobacteraceae bacterium]|nr:DinB family protein [Bryobacteraceae bacterium]
MNRISVTILTAALAGACAVQGQDNPLTTAAKRDYMNVRNNVMRSAEKMPEADYAFKPTPEVRSFAEQIAHIADDQYNICSGAKGETRNASYTAIESSLTKKADLVPALKKAFEYCDGAFASMTDAAGAEMAKGTQMRMPRLGVLMFNTSHTWLHYGNIIVYLRLKGLVPPSSERNR